MAYSVNWSTRVITIPRTDLTVVSGSPEVWSLDVSDLWAALIDIQDSEAGMVFPDIVLNTPPLTVAGVTLARVLQIINGYTLTFEDDQYAVNIIGGNSNVGDVTNKNQVSVNTANSAGLVEVGGADPWAVTLEGANTAADLLRGIARALLGKVSGAGTATETVRDLPDTKDSLVYTVDAAGNRTGVSRDLT